jgi:PAS domain S-box-containing protein
MSSTGHLSELDLLRSQVADLSRRLAERDRSAHDMQEHSDLLRAIVEATAAETGEEFFAALVTHLTARLKVQYAIIGEVLEDRIRKIRTLAVSAGDTLIDNFEYDLDHTPCATALTQTFSCFNRDLQATFPEFQRLVDLGAESYCAVPVRTNDGAVSGLLIVMDTKPLENSDYLQSLLGVFAPRIAAEFERRRAEQERAQALADLHNVIESIPDIVFALDTQGNLVKWNRRLRDATGYSPEELLNKSALAFVPFEEQTSTAAAIQRAFMEGYAELEGHLLTKDRRLIPYHWTGALLKDTHGEPIGIAGIGRDVAEKKQAKEELTQQRRHLVDAQALAHLGSWGWDIDTGQVQWSDELFRIFGHEPSSIHVMHDTFLAALLPDDYDRVLAAINDALAGKISYDIEYRIVRPNSEVRSIYARGDVYRDATGHPFRMAGTVLDITERKQVEEALRASEERWQLAVRGSNDGIWDWNIQSGTIFFSSRWKAMRGFEDHEIKNDVDEWRSRIHPDDLSRVLQSIESYLAKKTPDFCEEYRTQRKDGSYMWTLDRGVALWAENGTPLRMVGSESDVTEHRQALLRLAQQEALLHSILDAEPECVMRAAVDGTILQMNEAGLCFIETDSFAQVAGRSVYDLVAPEFLERYRSMHEAVIGGASQQFEFQIVGLKGTRRWVETHAVPLQNPIDHGVEHLAITRDITDRKRVEEALRESDKRLALAVEGSNDILWDALRLSGEPWYAPQTPIWWSPRVRELLGLQESDSFETFEHWFARLHPDDKDHVFGQLAAHIEQRVPYDVEYRLRTNAGDFRWIRGRGQALWDDQGEPRRMSGSCQDITERKQAQEALAQSERQLRTVLDALPVGVWFTDRSGKPLLANPAAKQIWSNIKQIGLQTENHQAGWWETIGPANEPHRWALSQVLTTGVPSLNETFDFECLDGTKKTIRNSTVPVKSEAGVTLGAIVLNEDITLLRQAQAALQLTQFSVDHAVEGFLWIGPDARIFHVNDSICRMLEYTWEELTTMTLHDIDPNLSSEVWPAHWEELRQKGSLTFESKYWSRTGRVLDMEVTVNYLQYEGKEYNCAIMRDIGERKRAEASLRQSEERYRSLVDNAPIGIFLNEAGRFVYANREMLRILKATSAEQLIGTPILDRIAPEFNTVVKDRIHELNMGQPVPSLDKKFVRFDGSQVDVAVSAIPTSLGGNPVMQVLALDITDRKHIEETLRQRERDLQAALQERERISQDLHDGILQSLFAVGLALETAKLTMAPRNLKTSRASLNQAIDQLNGVMHEIRNFIAGLGSDLLQGKNFPAVLKQMLASLTEHQATRVRLAVEDRAAKALSTEQSLHLIRVIQEAVSNCIKHGHAREARVSLKMLKRGVRLSVRDNGRGFNQDDAKGIGYGLGNMAARAQKIGGRFAVLSKVNVGTSIVLDLPKKAADVSR